MRATERYVDFEGAVRAGKTTPLIWKVILACQQHPGLLALLSRWTQDALDAQLKPRFYELCPPELLGRWNAVEQYQEFRNGSRLYLRALKSSDDAARYAKFAGLTLGLIGVDQAEELPEDVYLALKARLSQPKTPQQLLLTPNPPTSDHWLVREFPETNDRPDHLYLCTSVYDNVEWVGLGYIQALEREYPEGHVLRRRFLEGKRGLSTVGEPVYGSCFKRRLHVKAVEPVGTEPLFEAWDFGHKHPAVLWSQLMPWGEWRILGELLGANEYLDEFAPRALAIRTQLFGSVPIVQSCCDPAGMMRSSQGTRHSAVDILRDFGVFPRWIKSSNHPTKREWAIQQIARYMLRMTRQGPALQIHPRCRILIDAFEAGYVYEDKGRGLMSMPSVRRPKKDGYYEHLANCAEYTVLNFASGLPPEREALRAERQALRRAQRDRDPFDFPRVMPGLMSRAGY